MVSERRERILDVARGLILREGFAAASMHAVARAAGVTRPALYAEFGDRDELFAALLDREEQQVLDMAAAATPEVPPGADPVDITVKAVDIYLDLVLSAPESWQFVLMPGDGAPRDIYERVEQGRNAIRERSQALITILTALGEREPDEVDAELLSHAVISVCETAARLLVAEGGAQRRPEVSATLVWISRQVAAATGLTGHR